MPNSPNRFGQWLEATMQSRGLSQADMARQVGVADVQVSRWRRGQVTPSVRYLHRLASTFDVPRTMLDQLAGYPGDEPEQHEGEPEVNPQREAEIQAYQARYREIMTTQVPPRLWDAYAKACEALAEQLAASFDEAVSAIERADHDEDPRQRRSVGFHMQSRHEADAREDTP